jgi:hypothetical protein
MVAMALPAVAHAQAPACPESIDLHQGNNVTLCKEVKTFKASFLNRVWNFEGSVDAVDLDHHSLDMTTTGIENLPAQFNSQDDPIIDQDTHVTFRPKTRVYDPDGNLVDQSYLDYAESVVVAGKLTAPSHWYTDEAGDVVPTIAAKRIYIAQYVNSADDVQDAVVDSSDTAKDSAPADPAALDPTPGDGKVTTADVDIWIHLHLHFGR